MRSCLKTEEFLKIFGSDLPYRYEEWYLSNYVEMKNLRSKMRNLFVLLLGAREGLTFKDMRLSLTPEFSDTPPRERIVPSLPRISLVKIPPNALSQDESD